MTWALENLELNESFHLVHATHSDEKETRALAKSGANVVLCPTTEGNLGDGIFPAAPDRSLLLQKATATLPHGGGKPGTGQKIS